MTLEGGAIDWGTWQKDREETMTNPKRSHVSFTDNEQYTQTNKASPIHIASPCVMEDGTRIAFRDWGTGQPVVFSHGWPLAGDAWSPQMLFFASQGYRVIVHDRRGHGQSDQTWEGNTMDQYADDLAELLQALDLHDIILVGHSTGGGEIVRYMARHGTERVAKVVLVAAVMPLMLKTSANPEGTPVEQFDSFRQGVAGDRARFYKNLSTPFYGFNKEDADMNSGLRDSFWRLAMLGSIKAHFDCIQQFSEVDFTSDLRLIDKPTLIIHGDADQLVPIAVSALKSVRLVKDARLVVYPGASHGVAETEADKFNADVLTFIRE